MGRALVRILTGVAFSAIAGGIALAFGLQRIVASVLADYPTAIIGIALLISGLVGLISVGLLVASGVEDKVFDWISPRPRSGSLPYRDIIIEADVGTGAFEIVITLTNQNPELLAFDATMRGRVNGTDWRDAAGLDVLRFPGFAAASR